MDLSQDFIFDYNPPALQFPNARRLNLKDPRVVSVYLEFIRHACNNKALFHRTDYIHSNMMCPLSDVLRK